MKVIISNSGKLWRKYDLIPLPWREEEAKKVPKKLKIGYYTNGASLPRSMGGFSQMWRRV